ncbi:MAG TPA: hypothetical protein VIC27_07725, partial [Ktedonobacterales bacterium]
RDTHAQPRQPTQPLWVVLSLARYLTIAIPLYMASILLRAIWTHTPTVPFEDEWENLLMVHHYQTGTFSIGELWAFHNQHRIFIPRGIDLALAELTHYNRQIMMTFDVVVAMLTIALLVWAARKSLRSATLAWLLLAPFALLMLSVAQWENWLEPFQLTFIMTIFGVACTVRGFAQGPASTPGFAVALGGAVIAALSSFGGCAAFIAFFPCVLVAGWKRSLIWAAVALGILIPYFQGFPHSPLSLQLVGTLEYALAYLGAPISSGQVVSTLFLTVGSMLLAMACIAVYWLQHRTLALMSPWIGLALYALAAAGMTALGRNGGDPALAFSSRYQAFSGVWWVAVFALAAICLAEWDWSPSVAPASALMRAIQRALEPRRAWAALGAMAGVVAIGLMLLNQSDAMVAIENFQSGQAQQQQCVLQYMQAAPSCFQNYYPVSGKAQAYAAMMQQDNLGAFYEPGGSGADVIASPPAVSLELDRYVDHATQTYWTMVSLNAKQWDPFIGPEYQLDARLG